MEPTRQAILMARGSFATLCRCNGVKGPEMSRSVYSTALLLVAAAVPVVMGYRHLHVSIPAPPPDAPSTTWRLVPLSSDIEAGRLPAHVQDVVVERDGVGLAVGTARHLWRTVDGGHTWEPTFASAAAGAALRENGVGLIVGRHGVSRTADAGLTWTPVALDWTPVALGMPRPSLTRVAFIDHQTAIAIGVTLIIRSTDAGQTWSRLAVPAESYHGLAFQGRTGLVVGGSGLVLRSTDAGTTWSARLLDTKEMLRGVAFADARTAVAVGTNGLIARSEDAGQTWTAVPSGTNLPLRGVAFADAHHGLIAGFYGAMLRTRDGGRSWEAEESGTRTHLVDVTVTPAGLPIAVGWFDTILLRAALRGPSGSNR
jgi:photosystem II stability/assembly factor-like uncharacterized protein